MGLLHDFDYEKYPQVPDHPMKGQEILAAKGYADNVRRAIISHVPAMNVPRDSQMAKTLFGCDELCGFIVACSLVRPNKISDLEASSVRKKLKDKAFARTVNREDIYKGIEEMQVDMNEHIQFVINALKGVAAEIGVQ